MPAATLNVKESSAGAQQSTGNTMVVFGYASGATVNTVYRFSSDAVIPDEVGHGDGVELAMAIARQSGEEVILMTPTSGIASVLGSVTETPAGTGPAITVTGTPRHKWNWAVKISAGGANAVGTYRISKDDGTTYGDDLEIPAATAAEMIGTADLRTITLATLNGLTLIVDEDVDGGPQTITFTTPSDVADVAVQANAQTTGITASIVAGRLKLKSDTTGATSSIQIESGTALTILGFTASTVTGSAAAYTVPDTGVILTFGTGTYIVDTVYTFAATPPRFTTAALATCITALKDSGEKFGLMVLAQEEDTAAGTRVAADAVKANLDTLVTAKVFTRAWLGVLPTESDTDVKDAFNVSAMNAPRVFVAGGDAYIQGGAHSGTFRRPGQWAAAIACAERRFSSDLGNGKDGSLSFVSDITRDEYTASTKLRNYRFTVIETRPQSQGFWFTRGVSMAATGSVFADINACRVMDEACKILQPLLNEEVNNDPLLNANGTIAEGDALAIEKTMTQALTVGLLRPEGGIPHVSRVRVTVDRAEVMSVSRNLKVTFEIQLRGQQESVTGTIGFVSTLEEAA